MKRRTRPAKAQAHEIPAHDWRTTDAQEVERRRQRARDERMRIVNLHPAHPVCSNFAVQSGSGRTYHVEIRDPRDGEYACECVDFRANGLGTCKHVEAVLLGLGRRERAALKQARAGGGTRDDVVPDRENESLRLVPRASGKVPRELARWFLPDGRQRDEVGDGDDDRKAALAAWRDLAGSRLPSLRISQEVEPWLEVLHQRED
ncbi:MAG: SWIM zinc finger family protein, partial [Verrucomicrobiota bacterium]